MSSNFDEPIRHYGTGSIKWDQYSDSNIIALSTADMDFRSPDSVREACRKIADENIYNYRYKPDSFYAAVIDYYRRKFNWDVQREWITNGPGIWSTARILFGAFCKPGDRIIIQSPHFAPIPPLIEDAGCHVVRNPMRYRNGRYDLDFADFENKIKEYRPRVYFLVNPQNPTGRTFTREELTRLSDICTRYNVLTVSDEVHCNIQFPGSVHTPLPSLNEQARQNSILLHAASKGYNLMGLTFCIIIIPNDDLRREWLHVQRAYNFNFASNCYSVAATTAAFSRKSDAWLADVTAYLQNNLAFTLDYCGKYIPKLKPIKPDGGYLMWLDCHELGLTPAELNDFFLKKARVGLTYGDSYGPGGEGFERLNFATPRATLEEGLRRIRDAVNSL